MVSFLKCSLTIVFLVGFTMAQAQPPKTTKATAPAQKFTPPILTTVLGIHTDSAIVVLEEAVQLINLPIKITDDKKNTYTVTSYQFWYKKRGVTENEETGKVTPTYSTISDLFRATPLPEQWRRNISQQLRPGDELHFFDVIVKDTQGRVMFAPTLKINII